MCALVIYTSNAERSDVQSIGLLRITVAVDNRIAISLPGSPAADDLKIDHIECLGEEWRAEDRPTSSAMNLFAEAGPMMTLALRLLISTGNLHPLDLGDLSLNERTGTYSEGSSEYSNNDLLRGAEESCSKATKQHEQLTNES
ncbi:hypothetical protein PROFUN_11732 [Planoprotostelium fungivorum]|uniref:Uncharacterized protein n=1 Tax=Planoprotostelium fungivorum TaxID=1890364 RepID=A0A2P6MYD1_9EUKA|nr:hypothetical protein PROFUN_11732 [Planoprotostelium fungivorum]